MAKIKYDPFSAAKGDQEKPEKKPAPKPTTAKKKAAPARRKGRSNPERWGGPMRGKVWSMPVPWADALMAYIENVLDQGKDMTLQYAVYEILMPVMEEAGFAFVYDESHRTQKVELVKRPGGNPLRRGSVIPRGETVRIKVLWPAGFVTLFEEWADKEIGAGKALSEKDLVYDVVQAFLEDSGFLEK